MNRLFERTIEMTMHAYVVPRGPLGWLIAYRALVWPLITVMLLVIWYALLVVVIVWALLWLIAAPMRVLW